MVNLSIYSTRSHQVRPIIILGIPINLRLVTAGQIFLKTLFFFTQLSGINFILMFVSLNLMQSFEILFLMRGRPHQNAIYNIDNPVGLKLLTRLRLSCSHLNKHRFNHKFENCINTLSSCSLEIESTSHFLLHCHHYTNIQLTLLNNIAEIIGNIFNITNECWSIYYFLAIQNTLK